MRLAVLSLLLCLMAAPAWSQIVSERPDRVGLVIYPDLYDEGLVLVTEQRAVDLPAGPGRISFRGVADGIVPQTVTIQGLPGVREQNFDYNLLTPAALIRASEGGRATLVRTNRATGQITQEQALILSTSQGVVLDMAGRVEALKCGGLPERLVLDSLPPGFTDRPTLSLDAVVPKAGRYVLTVTYLALGVSWQANYVARLSPDRKRLNLSNWITINNQSASAFDNAPVQVLAGRLERSYETSPPPKVNLQLQPNCWALNSGRRLHDRYDLLRSRGGMESVAMPVAVMSSESLDSVVVTGAAATVQDLGDYKLYTLPERTTLAPYQTKQLLLFEKPDVAIRIVQRAGLHTAQDDPETGDEDDLYARDVIAFHNDKASNLGIPLPEGEVAVLRAFEGRDLVTRQVRLRDTPTGLPGEFVLAESFMTPVHTRVVQAWTTGSSDNMRHHLRMEVTAINSDSQPATFEIREDTSAEGFRIAASSRRSTLEQGMVNWTLEVPAHGEATLTYTLEWTGD